LGRIYGNGTSPGCKEYELYLSLMSVFIHKKLLGGGIMVLKNYMEELVFDAIKNLSKELSDCTCEKFMFDVAAIALNDLPTKYVVTEKGMLYSKIETLKQQFEVDIITAVTKAIEKVNKNPQH